MIARVCDSSLIHDMYNIYIYSGPCIFTIPSFCGFVKNKISVVYGIIIIHAISKLYFVMHKLNIWIWNKLVHCNSMFIQGRNYKYLTSISLIIFFYSLSLYSLESGTAYPNITGFKTVMWIVKLLYEYILSRLFQKERPYINHSK